MTRRVHRPGGEVVFWNASNVVRVLELRHELLSLSISRGVRLGSMQRLLEEVVIHYVAVRREVDRLHPLVKPVARLQFPLPERCPAGSSETDHRCNNNDSY